jgi:hypothetical protein
MLRNLYVKFQDHYRVWKRAILRKLGKAGPNFTLMADDAKHDHTSEEV